LLLLETGIKLEELFALKVSHFDFSNKYSPEMMIKHTGKKEKKSRKLKSLNLSQFVGGQSGPLNLSQFVVGVKGW
jgi:hypothetical protein